MTTCVALKNMLNDDGSIFHRRITVSTVGLVPAIVLALIQNLAISLNASTEERKLVMPITRKYR